MDELLADFGYARSVSDTPDRGAVQHGENRIEYTVVRSRRRRRTIAITLGEDGGVVVRAPLRTLRGVVADVVRRKAGWIARRQAEATQRPAPLQFVNGESLPYLGRVVPLSVSCAEIPHATVRFDGSSFQVGAPSQAGEAERSATVRLAMEGWYRQRALEVFEASAEHWAGVAGCAPGRVLVGNQKRQWGSCAPDGTLRLNWRLAMLDPSLIDYVVVHELVHLRVRSHSPQFWLAVAAVLPDYKERRKLLRDAGAALTL